MFTAHRFSLAGLLSLVLAHSAFAAECGPDQNRGAQVFANECSVCHAVAKGGATMMGPNLAGVYGRKSGSLAGFSYSQAMRDKNVEWQAETIAQFITQPQAFVPGTYMPYMGLASADDRQAVACFLKEQH
ncbi:c-type cytochrome [Pseudomonas sp. D6002]|uniref:c-type cytochrome n=1 Tax=unclassified Pseudomonas TaxID=196821 RepID=UPI0015A40DBF|nr:MULTISPECIES: c-type cytochrome [unclassified Pseudomonas]NVZ98145.1 c-type cytochrome [Pseudomonas sp. B6001]NWB16656.1 c-type cytochrome [Pseudomonas sp. D6002]NWB19747.1 c-type cytochrome [Pseudomonas sp. D4002]NWB69803.1 c-type cytochrome [Pseudomonas sp. I8001]